MYHLEFKYRSNQLKNDVIMKTIHNVNDQFQLNPNNYLVCFLFLKLKCNQKVLIFKLFSQSDIMQTK